MESHRYPNTSNGTSFTFYGNVSEIKHEPVDFYYENMPKQETDDNGGEGNATSHNYMPIKQEENNEECKLDLKGHIIDQSTLKGNKYSYPNGVSSDKDWIKKENFWLDDVIKQEINDECHSHTHPDESRIGGSCSVDGVKLEPSESCHGDVDPDDLEIDAFRNSDKFEIVSDEEEIDVNKSSTKELHRFRNNTKFEIVSGEGEMDINRNNTQELKPSDVGINQRLVPPGGEDSLQCTRCHFRMRFRRDLRKHRQDCAGEDVEFTEEENQNVNEYVDEILDMHVRDSRQGLLRSMRSTFQTKNYVQLMRYIKLTDDSSIASFKCPHCVFQTIYRGCLTRHIKRIHVENVPFVKCSQCRYQTKNKLLLAKHIKVKHEFVIPLNCPYCAFRSKIKDCLARHIKTHSEGVLLKCPYCTFKTKDKSQLVKHTREHESPAIFKCTDCVFQAQDESCVEGHVKAEHGGDIAFLKCTYCPFLTEDNACLVKHAKEIHNKGCHSFVDL